MPNSQSRVYYSRPTPGDRQRVDYTSQGRLSIEAVRELRLPPDADAYLCGPASFMNELSAGLVEYGLDPAHLHMETK